VSQTSQQPSEQPDPEAAADRAAASGDLASARRLLQQAVADQPGRIDPWLKLSAMCRALGDLPAALDAVSGALRIEPLGFLPLLLKASLLERSGRPDEAGEYYGYALAQRPAEVPAHLRSMVAHAEQVHAGFAGRKAARLAAAETEANVRLSDVEQARLDRFRSNIVRTTRPYHSEPTHFHYPGLREREYLVQNGVVIDANARHCPATMALLPQLDCPDIPRRGPNAMFSLLAPGAHIPPHNGIANTRLVCHLPLIVPPGCWFRVGAERREWEVGKAWVFDDTIEHEAMNPTSSLRVILIVDAWHHDLSFAERAAVGAIMAATDPTDPDEGL
jgi:hypothetical protein